MASLPTRKFVSVFTLGGLKKFPELIPLVGILGAACSMATCYMGYSLYFKSDVIINKNAETQPYDRVNPEQQQKLHRGKAQYKKIPELEALRKEIGSYKPR